MALDIIERLETSAQHQLCLPLLPFSLARSESINADSLNSNSFEEGVAAGHSRQFTPGSYLLTMIHTTLAGIEPTTLRLLVRHATSSATETTYKMHETYESV